MKTIGTAREYFDEVIEHNFQQFRSQSTHLPSAFNLANSLFCMHEWLWNGHETQLNNYYQKTLKNKAAFSNLVQSQYQSFKHIRDLANASKHVTLTLKPSTAATSITDTAAIEDDYVEVGYVEEDYALGKGIYINDGGNYVDFKDCADEVYNYWRNLLAQMGL